MKPSRVWIGLVVVYAVFFSWYTSCGGPLTEQEIAGYMARLEAGDMEPARLALFREFMRSDTGDDFAMLNAIDYRDEPLPVDGALPGETSQQVLNRYSRPFLLHALRSAAHPILLGTAAAPAVDVWGMEGADQWDFGGLVRYRSRRDLMEQLMYLLGSDSDLHAFKRAAIEKTIAYPLDPFFYAGDPRLLLALLLLIAGLSWELLRSRRASAAR